MALDDYPHAHSQSTLALQQPFPLPKRTKAQGWRGELALGARQAPGDPVFPRQGGHAMLRQPETRPISHDQLVVEVKGVYAGLVMVEAKCIEVDERQKMWAQNMELAKENPVTRDQWRSLIALHKQLLHEHHDFFLASQHPSASYNLSKLAAKYIMPARMWRHGIHGFLEVLQHRLPGSLEHMLAFIYIAYSIMALLFETVPSFEDSWIECLGDLARYRMAIEDEGKRTWAEVVREYYRPNMEDRKAAIAAIPSAILERIHVLENLSKLTKPPSSCVSFESAQAIIRMLSNPVLLGNIEAGYKHGLRAGEKRANQGGFLNQQIPRYSQNQQYCQQSNYRQQDRGSRSRPGDSNTTYHADDGYDHDQDHEVPSYQELLLSLESYYKDIMIAPEKKIPEDDDLNKSASRTTIWQYVDGTTTDKIRASCSGRLSEDFPMRNPDSKRPWWDDINPASITRDAHTIIDPAEAEQIGLSTLRQRTTFQSSPILNMVQRLVLGASLLRVSVAMPTSATQPETSAISYENFYVGLLYLLSAGLFVGAAQYVSKLQGPITTHGIAMSVQSLGWWSIANDDTTSKGLRFIVLMLWTISTWQYFHAASAKLQVPRWASLGSIILATGFDICVVRAITPNNLAVSQKDILTLSLPSVSLALGVTVITVPIIQRRLGQQALAGPSPPFTAGDPNINTPAVT